MMILCICGPSGVGKTKLSISLAKKYNAIIINCDATQVYKGLDIGSAKITPKEKDGIKHYLIDIKNPDENYSVCEFQKDARNILNQHQNENIIVVGGTGLYINALFYDYHFENMKNDSYDDVSVERLYEMALSKGAPSNLDAHNRIRIINFLNKEKMDYNKDKILYDVTFIGLTTDREIVYKTADKRVDEMVNMGLVDEVKSLYQKYPNSNILKRAIGYKEIISYINGEISYDEAINLVKKNTRHYIKRQYTWLNHQLPVKWFDVKNFEKTYEEITSFIASLNSK